MDTTTAADRLPAGFLPYGEVVMAAPARPGDLAHRRASQWIPKPAPDGTDPTKRTGRTFVRPACEPAPDPAETTATLGWREADFWQFSAGWADYLHAARPCPAAQCFPDQEGEQS
ncbi:hypothetical protein WEI85_18085 [Actinomycetes bacterium KLBMP 9797]